LIHSMPKGTGQFGFIDVVAGLHRLEYLALFRGIQWGNLPGDGEKLIEHPVQGILLLENDDVLKFFPVRLMTIRRPEAAAREFFFGLRA
jgi:hypothetical protein